MKQDQRRIVSTVSVINSYGANQRVKTAWNKRNQEKTPVPQRAWNSRKGSKKSELLKLWSSSKAFRATQAIFSLFCFAVFLAQVCSILELYLQYPTRMEVFNHYDNKMVGPAVTVSNFNECVYLNPRVFDEIIGF